MTIDVNNGLWLLPSRARATTNLPRFFKAAKATGMTTAGAVLVDEADYAENHDAYDALELPDNWSIYPVKADCCAEATQLGYLDLCEGLDWIGWLADDLVPETPNWDVKCIESLTGWNCVSTDDGKFAPHKMNGATVWSGDLVRAVGYLYPPGFRHFYIDTAWEELGRMMNIWLCRMDILVRHLHPSYGRSVPDQTTAHTQQAWQIDEASFVRWKNEERLAAAERIGELLLQYGVASPLPDLSKAHVLLATPNASGRYERLFVQSLWGTIEALRACKALVNFAEIPYCSDICHARAKLFGMFLRSQATHMLFIDDDMGWNPQDVIRMFVHDRDFVAVAGPRKAFPPSFAVQTDAPMRQEATTGLIEVSQIGLAFVLITRAVALRVSQAHPELKFVGDDGREEFAVFNPMVVNGRYSSEDFAFCERWRALGGKIYCDPTISLKHVGTFVWEGSWQNHLLQTANKRQAA
jgi:hypothetical protein